ncbi:MAG: BspA family leucine-rich repeat surface protein, partial [Sulfurovum sp.]
GGTDAGGTDAGGTDAGGTDAGGTDAGGTDAGGTDAGGTDAGGTDTGGTDAGGTDTGGTDAEVLKIAYLLDSKIKGISYTTSSGLTGVTDINGTFRYKEDDTKISFSIGSVPIGSINPFYIEPGGKTFVTQLLDEPTPMIQEPLPGLAVPRKVLLLQLLQTLDEDEDPSNGIEITNVMAQSLNPSLIDFKLNQEKGIVQLPATIEGRTLVTPMVAAMHYFTQFKNDNEVPELNITETTVNVVENSFDITTIDFRDNSGYAQITIEATDNLVQRNIYYDLDSKKLKFVNPINFEDIDSAKSFLIDVVATDANSNKVTKSLTIIITDAIDDTYELAYKDIPNTFVKNAKDRRDSGGFKIYTDSNNQGDTTYPTVTIEGEDKEYFQIRANSTPGYNFMRFKKMPDYSIKSKYNIIIKATLGSKTVLIPKTVQLYNHFNDVKETPLVLTVSDTQSFNFSMRFTSLYRFYDVDCDNDGVFEVENQIGTIGDILLCEFNTGGSHEIALWGDLDRSSFNMTDTNFDTNAKKITKVSFGNKAWIDMSYMFRDADNLALIVNTPIFHTTDKAILKGMFRDSSMNIDISSWNVINVTDMSEMFMHTDMFNKNLSLWDVQYVTNMHSMFNNADVFEKDISSWEVDNVTDMGSMFKNADAFNVDISYWHTGKVTDMSEMFMDTAIFNQNLSAWHISNVVNSTDIFTNSVITSIYNPFFIVH